MLYPKIATYFLNALIDAEISNELVLFIKNGHKKSISDNSTASVRARRLLEDESYINCRYKTDYIIAVAYTQYYLNGLADYLSARFMLKIFSGRNQIRNELLIRESIKRIKKHLNSEYLYDEYSKIQSVMYWYWPVVIMNPWIWIKKFSEQRCGYKRSLDRNTIKKALITVQKHNISNNLEVADIIEKNKPTNNIKIMEIRKSARLSKNPDAFLKISAQTQRTAAGWDRVFVRYIEITNR